MKLKLMKFLLNPVDSYFKAKAAFRMWKLKKNAQLRDQLLNQRSFVAPEGWEIRKYGSFESYLWPKGLVPPGTKPSNG